jgi:coatomer protein complex subunit epsilon
LAELLTIHNAFHCGQYSAVIEHDLSGLSTENKLAARVYILRSRIASHQAGAVATELEGEADDVPDLGVLKAFAKYAQENNEEAIKAIDAFVESSSDNATVQVIGATVLHSEGRSEEALALLSKHQGSLEACVFFNGTKISPHTLRELPVLIMSFYWQCGLDCPDSTFAEPDRSGNQRGPEC